MAESKLTPAKPLLDYRQAKFMQRLMARPKGHQGPEEILERLEAQLTERLRQVSFLGPEDRPEELCWARHRAFPGCIQIEERKTAYRTAKEWTDRKNSAWTDGSRLEDGAVGAAVAWWEEEGRPPPWVGPVTGRAYTPGWREAGWTGRRYHLGRTLMRSCMPCIRLQRSSMVAANRARTTPYCRSGDRACAV